MRLLLLLALLAPFPAHSAPVAMMTGDDFRITLHDTKCAVPEITNLKRRAVWFEKGKEVEGCWGVSQKFGMVLMYFADKTATALPMQVFEKVTGT
jgi:hypothetical protein